MGSFAYCLLDNLVVGTTKNYVDADLISLFRSADKQISSIQKDFPSNPDFYNAIFEEDPDAKIVYYEASISIIKDRLYILGYDIETAKCAFRLWIKEKQKDVLNMMNRFRGGNSDSNKFLIESLSQQYQILEKLTPEIWIEKIKLMSPLKKAKIKTIIATQKRLNP